ADRDCIPATAPRARVLTYNVNFGGPGMDEAIAAIRKADADVVCLQETTAGWNHLLAQEFAGQYPYQCNREFGGAGGQAVLSKHPIYEIDWVDSKAGWFPGYVLLTGTPAGPLQFLSVHLKPPLSDNGSLTPSAYFGAGSVHKAEVTQFLKACKPGLPTVVLGDFNENDCGDGVVTLEQAGFADALPQFDRRSATWHWPTQYLELTGRYDHILYSSDLACLKAAVIQKGQSDHYPVVAELARKPDTQP
ncbi:MAG TPA: endonuclease/exonuclease/phosphatase family protein, partial [Planctomycetota bacterium]|nr:endonuclease/exonuclease/phosphatase family protein [Planctomycetota bacterium]